MLSSDGRQSDNYYILIYLLSYYRKKSFHDVLVIQKSKENIVICLPWTDKTWLVILVRLRSLENILRDKGDVPSCLPSSAIRHLLTRFDYNNWKRLEERLVTAYNLPSLVSLTTTPFAPFTP